MAQQQIKQLVVPESSLASAFYEGCGKIFEFLGAQIKYWVGEAVEFLGDTLQAIKRAIESAWEAAKNLVNRAFSWITDFGKLVGPYVKKVGEAIAAGVSFVVGAFAAIGDCLRGAYSTDAGKWIAAAGLGFAALVAFKFVAASVAVRIFAPILIAPVVQWLVGAVQGVWHFNWNITDKEIEAQNKARIDGLFSLLGSTAGTVVGQVVCGAAPGVATVAVNPRLLIHLKKELGEEIYEECVSSIYGLIQGTVAAYKRISFLNAFKNIRRLIKGYNQYPWFKELVGERASSIIERWGSESSKPFVFAEKFESWIESVQDKNKRLGNFLEEFFEELFENCGEAVVTWATAVDNLRFP